MNYYRFKSIRPPSSPFGLVLNQCLIYHRRLWPKYFTLGTGYPQDRSLSLSYESLKEKNSSKQRRWGCSSKGPQLCSWGLNKSEVLNDMSRYGKIKRNNSTHKSERKSFLINYLTDIGNKTWSENVELQHLICLKTL